LIVWAENLIDESDIFKLCFNERRDWKMNYKGNKNTAKAQNWVKYKPAFVHDVATNVPPMA
jgi:hypothetical protein